jgi:phosphoglycerate dehydrogenase-like enzyme
MVRVAILNDYQGVAQQYADWSRLPAGSDVQVFREHLPDEDARVEALRDFDTIVAMRERTPFPRSLLQRLPNLRLLVTTGGGNAAIDLTAAQELGIVVSGTRGFGTATAELTWGLILALLRHIPAEDRNIREGGWQTTVGTDLSDKTLGVLGLGNLGSQVARVGRTFGMEVIAWSQNLTHERAQDQGVALVSKQELLERSDILTIHLVLSDRTRGLLAESDLRSLKPGAYLINTSRGPIVDEPALIRALSEGWIAGAAIDVYESEPLPLEHPLRRLPNTVVTPHLGYVTERTYERFYGDALEDILAFLQGKPMRPVTPRGRA